MKKKLKLLAAYERARGKLEVYKAVTFYHGTQVCVECPRYKGPGVALSDTMLEPDRVAVKLPNGIVQVHELQHVMPALKQEVAA